MKCHLSDTWIYISKTRDTCWNWYTPSYQQQAIFYICNNLIIALQDLWEKLLPPQEDFEKCHSGFQPSRQFSTSSLNGPNLPVTENFLPPVALTWCNCVEKIENIPPGSSTVGFRGMNIIRVDFRVQLQPSIIMGIVGGQKRVTCMEKPLLAINVLVHNETGLRSEGGIWGSRIQRLNKVSSQ